MCTSSPWLEGGFMSRSGCKQTTARQTVGEAWLLRTWSPQCISYRNQTQWLQGQGECCWSNITEVERNSYWSEKSEFGDQYCNHLDFFFLKYSCLIVKGGRCPSAVPATCVFFSAPVWPLLSSLVWFWQPWDKSLTYSLRIFLYFPHNAMAICLTVYPENDLTRHLRLLWGALPWAVGLPQSQHTNLCVFTTLSPSTQPWWAPTWRTAYSTRMWSC